MDAPPKDVIDMTTRKQQRAVRLIHEVVAHATFLPVQHEPGPYEFNRIPVPVVWRKPTDKEVDAAVVAAVNALAEHAARRLTEDLVNAAVVAVLPTAPAYIVTAITAGVMRAIVNEAKVSPNEILGTYVGLSLVVLAITIVRGRGSTSD